MMEKQWIAMLLLAFGAGSAVAQTHSPQPPMQQAPAVDWRLELLDTAVRKGKAEGWTDREGAPPEAPLPVMTV